MTNSAAEAASRRVRPLEGGRTARPPGRSVDGAVLGFLWEQRRGWRVMLDAIRRRRGQPGRRSGVLPQERDERRAVGFPGADVWRILSTPIAAVAHGFRSSFSDSAAEKTDHPRGGGHRGGAGARRPEQGRGGVCAVGPVRASAAADGRLVGVPWRVEAGRKRRPETLPERSQGARPPLQRPGGVFARSRHVVPALAGDGAGCRDEVAGHAEARLPPVERTVIASWRTEEHCTIGRHTSPRNR